MNRFLDIPAAQYHADDIGESAPTLTQSIANEMVSRSPWHAHRIHPKLGKCPRKSTDSQKLGTVLHALLLGHDGIIDVIDVDDYKTKASQIARDASTTAGRVPVKKREYGEALEQAARIDNTLRRDHGIELGRMKRELTAVWNEQTDVPGQAPVPVVCRARLDAFDGSTVYDLKTCADASPAKLTRSVIQFGYHVQGAAYVSAVEHVDIRFAGRVGFADIFIENETLAINVKPLDSMFMELGRQRWQECVNAWQRCLATGVWPGYADGDGPGLLECPEWYKMANDVELTNLRRKVFHETRGY